MGKKYLIDTNVLIDAQMRKLPASGLSFLASVMDEDFIISFITYIEYLGFKSISEAAEQFVGLANVIYIDKEIIDTCIKLRRNLPIKLPDAIIAATVMAKDLVLVTRNVSDFKNIKGLNVLNPWEEVH